MTRFELQGKRIWITGHTGMLGRALCKQLQTLDCDLMLTTRQQLDLTRQADVESWLIEHQPDVIIHTAALVGGIEANRTQPADFLAQNTLIAMNVIHAAASMNMAAEQGAYPIQKLIAFGSSCFYPKHAPQPLCEESLLTGELEATNEGYALAKILTAKLCQLYRRQYGYDFIAAVPTNLYGPGCDFDPLHSHVIAGLIHKFHHAAANHQNVNVWGTGKPEREFLFVDDAADAVLFLLEHYSSDALINIAGGETVAIATLAQHIQQLVGHHGELVFDVQKPDGMMKKSLDASHILKLGWRPSTSLAQGLAATYADYLQFID